MLQSSDADPRRAQTWPGDSRQESGCEIPRAGDPDSCLAKRSWALGPDPGPGGGHVRCLEKLGEVIAEVRGSLPVVNKLSTPPQLPEACRPGAGGGVFP